MMRRYTAGDRVVQAQYGAGTIVDTNEHHTVIDFDDHGVRRFVTTLAVLESTTKPAPPRQSRVRRTKRTVPQP